jgi:hypothetical protein
MSTRARTSQDLLADGVQLMADMLDRSLNLGLGAADHVRERTRSTLTMPGRSCGCDIPPPCWYPKAAGELKSHVCPGATASLRVRITNCGPTPRTVEVTGTQSMKVDPSSLQLGPMERGIVTVSVGVPSGAATDTEHLVWLRGCHDHFIRWTVCSSTRGVDSCHELDVEDCPDYLHHWYDHFYCPRPCPGDLRQVQPVRRTRARG